MSNNKARKTSARGGWLVEYGIFKFEEMNKANEES